MICQHKAAITGHEHKAPSPKQADGYSYSYRPGARPQFYSFSFDQSDRPDYHGKKEQQVDYHRKYIHLKAPGATRIVLDIGQR
jgi:hypothetical protein